MAVATEESLVEISDEVRKHFDSSIRLLGESGFRLLNQGRAAVLGVSPLVFEISKNLLISGIESLIFSSVGNDEIVKAVDLSSNFCLRNSDIGQSCFNSNIIGRLQSLNPNAKIQVVSSESTDALIKDLLTSNVNSVVCCGIDTADVIALNEACVSVGIPLINCDTIGLFGMIMCDFGDKWEWKRDPNCPPKSAMISHICKSDTSTVISISEDETHGLSEGDSVLVSGVSEGMTELNGRVFRQVSVLTPHSISFDEDSSEYADYKKGGMITQFRKDEHIKHCRLSTLMSKEIPSDLESSIHVSGDLTDQSALQWCCHRLFPYIRSHPGESTEILYAEIASFPRTVRAQLNSLLSMCSVSVAPMVSLIAGLASFEAVKAITQCFKPLTQCLFTNVLRYYKEGSKKETVHPRNQSFIECFGHSALQKLLNHRLVLVGESQISSELLKNFALIGVGTHIESVSECKSDSEARSSMDDRSSPLLTVIPDDQTSNSNHLCIGSLTSLKELNPEIKADKVCFKEKSLSQDDSLINVDMLSSVACVLSATDNINTRLKLDSLCLRSKTGLIDSTMNNSIGKCQVFIPHITECLSSNRDHIRMQGGSILTEYKRSTFKICTVRNFPFRIEHCLQWASEMFVALFKESIECVCDYLSEPSDDRIVGKLERDWLEERLLTFRPSCLKDCIWFARYWFEKLFCNEIKQLIHSFPIDHTIPDGSPFWVGSKLFPNPLVFDPTDDLHRSMIVNCGLLYARVYGLSVDSSRLNDKGLDLMLADLPKLKDFVPDSKKKIATSDEEFERMSSVESAEAVSVSELPSADDLSDLELHIMSETEYKSDEIALNLVHCLANLRADNYGISKGSLFESMGWICELPGLSPCLASALAGSMAIECIAMCQSDTDGLSEQMKDWTMTLNREMILDQSIPNRCKVHSVEYKDINNGNLRKASFSLWDEICVDSAQTLQDVLDYFTRDFGCEVGMVSYGRAILYAFFHSASKKGERSSKDLVSLIEEITKSSLEKPVSEVFLEVSLSDADDNDVEVPTVRVVYSVL